jgi:hypothetical protein
LLIEELFENQGQFGRGKFPLLNGEEDLNFCLGKEIGSNVVRVGLEDSKLPEANDERPVIISVEDWGICTYSDDDYGYGYGSGLGQNGFKNPKAEIRTDFQNSKPV